MWLKRLAGTGICKGRTCTCLRTLDRWQGTQARAHVEISLAIPLHTYLAEIKRREARMPGCEMLWTESKTCLLNLGTNNLPESHFLRVQWRRRRLRWRRSRRGWQCIGCGDEPGGGRRRP